MKKRIFIILGIALVVILVLLAVFPMFLQKRVAALIRKNVNQNIHGTFDFSSSNLSLIRNFPNARLSLEELHLLNAAPFEGDTLFKADEIALAVGFWEIFKIGKEQVAIEEIIIDGGLLNIHIDSLEQENYDILRGSSNSGSEYRFDLKSYEIRRSEVDYRDDADGIFLNLSGIEHRGTGDLSLNESVLQTNTQALLSLAMDSTEILDRNTVDLEARIGIDLENYIYTFLENKGTLNQLELEFEGQVQLFDDYTDVDIRFKTPVSDFRNILGIIPERISQNIQNVETSGAASIGGYVKGRLDDDNIPPFSIDILANDAMFKYPSLPKRVEDITLDMKIRNETGKTPETYLDISKASFRIDDDTFSVVSRIEELMGNMRVAAQVLGTVNLSKLPQAFPMKGLKQLRGILRADLNTRFAMDDIQKKQYRRMETKGNMNLRNFSMESENITKPVSVERMQMEFNPRNVRISEMNGVYGKSDFAITGTVTNWMEYLFLEDKLKGDFVLNSKTFEVDDFKTSGDGASREKGKLELPEFLDCSIQATAGTVRYEDITLRDVSGNMRIRDREVNLQEVTSKTLGGDLAFGGQIETKTGQPMFRMALDMNSFDIGETLSAFNYFNSLAPLAGILKGKWNSDISISGRLFEDMKLDLNSISGNLLTEILAADLGKKEEMILQAISQKLNFFDPQKINLKGLKTVLAFNDGQVQVKPFTWNYQDIQVKVSGGHSFDKKLTYTLVMDVPAKYLGKEVSNLLAEIKASDLQNLTIPVTTRISGTVSKPEVTTDLKAGVKDLTTRLVEYKKQQLVDKGKEKAGALLDNLIKGKKKQDTIKKQDTTGIGFEKMVKEIIKKPQDTAQAAKSDPIRKAATNILGGLLKGKPKDSVKVRKDSVN